jgi:hypothetical protein
MRMSNLQCETRSGRMIFVTGTEEVKGVAGMFKGEESNARKQRREAERSRRVAGDRENTGRQTQAKKQEEREVL